MSWVAPPATRSAAALRVGSTWYVRMLANAWAGSACTIASALAKPSRVAKVPKAASVGANTVSDAFASLSVVASPALVAAASSALKLLACATWTMFCVGAGGVVGSSSSSQQAVSTAALANAAIQVNHRFIESS